MRRSHDRHSGAELVAGFEKRSGGAMKLAVCLSGLLASLAGLAGGSPGNDACWTWGRRQRDGAGREDVCDPLEMR